MWLFANAFCATQPVPTPECLIVKTVYPGLGTHEYPGILYTSNILYLYYIPLQAVLHGQSTFSPSQCLTMFKPINASEKVSGTVTAFIGHLPATQ